MREGTLAALDAIEQATGENEVNADRLLHRRHAAGGDARLHGGAQATTGSQPAPSSPPRSTSPKPATSASSSTRSSSPALEADDEARSGYLEGARHGDDLQHAARQRPDLVVRREQLPAGQGPLPVRPAVLELRRDAHAAAHAQLLPAQHVPGEPAGAAGRARRSTTCRSISRKVDDPDLPAGRQGRPHRAVRSVYKARSSSAGRCASCWRARATSPAWSIRRAASKYQHWTNERQARRRSTTGWPARPSTRARGGPTGTRGCRRKSGPKVPAREPGEGGLPAIEDAPGSYVKVRIAD